MVVDMEKRDALKSKKYITTTSNSNVIDRAHNAALDHFNSQTNMHLDLSSSHCDETDNMYNKYTHIDFST